MGVIDALAVHATAGSPYDFAGLVAGGALCSPPVGPVGSPVFAADALDAMLLVGGNPRRQGMTAVKTQVGDRCQDYMFFVRITEIEVAYDASFVAEIVEADDVALLQRGDPGKLLA